MSPLAAVVQASRVVPSAANMRSDIVRPEADESAKTMIVWPAVRLTRKKSKSAADARVPRIRLPGVAMFAAPAVSLGSTSDFAPEFPALGASSYQFRHSAQVR